MFTNKYPYTDFHELNADLLIETVNDAASTAASMNTRVTTLETRANTFGTDIANLKADVDAIEQVNDTQDTQISGLQSSVNSLVERVEEHRVRFNEDEDLIRSNTNRVAQAELDIDNLDTRVTALEETPAVGGVTEYLRFSSASTPFDYDARITYSYLDDLIGTTASVDKLTNIILVEDDDVGTTWYYTLNEGEYQVSAGTPRGQFTFTCRKPVLDSNNAITGYNVCTVTVNTNAAAPSYSEVYEAVLPGITSSDSGKVLAVDSNGEWALDTQSGGETRTAFQITTSSGSGATLLYNGSYYNDNELVINVTVSVSTSKSFSDALLTLSDITSLNLAFTNVAPLMAAGYTSPGQTAMDVQGFFAPIYSGILGNIPQAGVVTFYGVIPRITT